jgi:hypothetical protein
LVAKQDALQVVGIESFPRYLMQNMMRHLVVGKRHDDTA